MKNQLLETPFHYAPRRLSFHDKQEVGKMVQQLTDERIIQPSDSPYATPIVLVSKKDESTRMCVDYRTLNKLTVKDNFPLSSIEDCLQYLEGKKCFSLLDLRSGFHRFVPFLSREAGPLLNLVKKNTAFNFDKNCERSFKI